MEILIDEQPVTLTGATLGELLEEARELLDERGRIIAEVEVDGSPLVGDGLEEAQDRAVEGDRLVLRTEDARALTLSALAEIDEQLPRAAEIQAEAADLLQGDEPVEAFERVADAIGIWLAAHQTVAQTALLMDIDLESLELGEGDGGATIDHLRERLTELKDLMTRGDTVALADSLAYEWPETVDRWRALVASLSRAIGDTDR
ncbi:hypothetical protein [Mucisphaera calidilacus]|uniref:hypothetical protein n=1 Tax=Mucisphaera calidilacus TaxID=2527982 RepID=UPI0011A5A52C|nr:hypothetical protein [Mucisphaera calidilacus]